MTTRKPSYNEEIRNMKNEIDTIRKFMLPRIKEVKELLEITRTRTRTAKEDKRLNELVAYIHEKNCEMQKYTKAIEASIH